MTTKRIKIFTAPDLKMMERRVNKGLELLNARNGTFVSFQVAEFSEPNTLVGVLVYVGDEHIFDPHLPQVNIPTKGSKSDYTATKYHG